MPNKYNKKENGFICVTLFETKIKTLYIEFDSAK